MNSDLTYRTTTSSLNESLELGARLGRSLKGGEVIELASDLGGGKTVLVKGICKGLGYRGQVTSPTFTISRVYEMPGGLELHHFDFYRLGAGDVVAMELAEILGDPNIIVAIEWAGNAGDVLPSDRLCIEIESVNETTRDITVTALGPNHAHAVKGLA